MLHRSLQSNRNELSGNAKIISIGSFASEAASGETKGKAHKECCSMIHSCSRSKIFSAVIIRTFSFSAADVSREKQFLENVCLNRFGDASMPDHIIQKARWNVELISEWLTRSDFSFCSQPKSHHKATAVGRMTTTKNDWTQSQILLRSLKCSLGRPKSENAVLCATKLDFGLCEFTMCLWPVNNYEI